MKDSYIEIEVDKSQHSFWSPSKRVLSLGKDRDPLVVAHELAHIELEHDISGSPLTDLIQERDAWKKALRRINPEEIKLGSVGKSMGSYLRDINYEYGRTSPQYSLAKRVTKEIIEYAKQRKKEAK